MEWAGTLKWQTRSTLDSLASPSRARPEIVHLENVQTMADAQSWLQQREHQQNTLGCATEKRIFTWQRIPMLRTVKDSFAFQSRWCESVPLLPPLWLIVLRYAFDFSSAVQQVEHSLTLAGGVRAGTRVVPKAVESGTALLPTFLCPSLSSQQLALDTVLSIHVSKSVVSAGMSSGVRTGGRQKKRERRRPPPMTLADLLVASLLCGYSVIHVGGDCPQYFLADMQLYPEGIRPQFTTDRESERHLVSHRDLPNVHWLKRFQRVARDSIATALSARDS